MISHQAYISSSWMMKLSILWSKKGRYTPRTLSCGGENCILIPQILLLEIFRTGVTLRFFRLSRPIPPHPEEKEDDSLNFELQQHFTVKSFGVNSS